MHYSNHPVTKEYRQILRRTTTPTENMLWRRLKGKQLDGLRFRQQLGYGPYVLDFYCPSLRLCIELDGNIHDEEQVRLKDEERTEFLLEQRIHVLRFRNEDVENDVEGVLERIREYINRVIINKTEAVQTPVAP
jgi:very-short-patch-repair endonuclease